MYIDVYHISADIVAVIYLIYFCTDLRTSVGTATDLTTEWPYAKAPLDRLAVACERDNMHVTISLASTEPEGNR